MVGLYSTHVTSRVSLDVIFTHIMVQIPVRIVNSIEKATGINDLRPDEPSIRHSLNLRAQWPNTSCYEMHYATFLVSYQLQSVHCLIWTVV